MTKKPLIVVTNDDGIGAPGIHALVEAAKPFGRLMVVAPDTPQSGMGHAITINSPVHYRKDGQFGDDIEAYSCSGTPADCVKMAMHILKGEKPDLIVSGVNHGANFSTNVLYSGTMSAAIEGALQGVPSIGFSLLDFALEADFKPSIGVAKVLIREILEKKLMKDVCLNVNIPKLPDFEIKGMKVCRQARGFWKDSFQERVSPFGKPYFWMAGDFENYDGGEDTDIWALENGYVSIVPIQFDLTANQAMGELGNWNLNA